MRAEENQGGVRKIPRPDMGTLVIKGLAAHVVPQRAKGDDDVTLNLMGAESPLTDETRQFLTRRVKETLNNAGQVVDVHPDSTEAVVPATLESLLDVELSLIEASQATAKELFRIQGGSNNQGVLIMLKCILDGQPAAAILKVEHERGVQLDEVEVQGGGTALDMTVLENLLLTENTKTFKAGIFFRGSGDLIGLVSDDQTGSKKDVARFFLQTFLGMRLAHVAAVVTESFVAGVTEWANMNVTDIQEREDLIENARLEVQAQGDLDIVNFIQTRVNNATAQDDLQGYLVDAKHVPAQPFEKDLSRLSKPQIENASWFMENGIKVHGPASYMKSSVRSATVNGVQGVFVAGDVKRIT